MSEQFIIRNHTNLVAVIAHLSEMKVDKPMVIDIKLQGTRRSLSQNALFHKWCVEISDFLIKKGRKIWTPEFTKDSLKHTFLGYEEVERTDMKTGVIRVSSELKHTSKLATPEMYFFMSQVDAWANNVGCNVTIPARCDYSDLKQKQGD